jgi:kinetochore protein Nuf2
MSSFIQDSQYNNPNARGASYMPPRHTFSFPLLKTDEIAKCLNELGIPIRQEELQTPDNHTEACRRMLESMAEICTGISKEEMAQPSFVGLQTVPHPELHEESIPKLNHFRAVCKMMEICEIPDFTIKDFMSPTAARLRRHLSGIINFAKFREERLLLLSDLSSSREALVDELNQLRERNDTLNNRLSLLREQTAEETGIITGLETECREIEANISQLNKLQSKLKDETTVLKGSNTDMKELILTKAQQQEELVGQRKQMGLQIVSSPEKFRKQIVEVGQTLQAEQKDSKAAEKKVRELTAWLSNVDETQGEVKGAIESVTELRGEVDRQKNHMADLENQRQTIVTSQAALSEVEQNTQQLQRHGSRAEEKLQHLRKQVHMRGSESQQAIDDLHKQLIEAEAFRLQVRVHLMPSTCMRGISIGFCPDKYRLIHTTHTYRIPYTI